MKSNIFREYDIRGIIGSELPIEETYDLAAAIATFLVRKHPDTKKFIVGRDGRAHSLPIHANLIAAITDLGYNVIDVGLCHTPAVYFAVHRFKTPTALMVSASHNPKEYNGIKIWGAWGAQIQDIRKIYETKTWLTKAARKGTVEAYAILNDYLDYMEQQFPHLKGLPIKAVVDCGNGAGGTVFPDLVKRMRWPNVKLLFPEVDGDFPNHEADPTVPENMTFVADELAKDKTLEVGVGLDGDCDRMNPMTTDGTLVSGDKLLAVFAKKVLQTHPGAAVVFDIKSSGSLIEVLEKWGAKPCIAPSGHSLIKQAMAKNNAALAGELSCHFFFHDRYFGYDDGLYATLRLFEILAESGQRLDELLKVFPHKECSPEIRIKCASDAEKVSIVEEVSKVFAARKDSSLLTIDGIRASMPYGWGLIRASNTQPVICLRFESSSHEGLRKVKEDFYKALQPFFTEEYLRKYIDL